MDDVILITELNDFVFCPASIYFHKLYGSMDTMLFQSTDQINGTNAHERIDIQKYSTSKHILMSFDVYSEKYRLLGKSDMFDVKVGLLRERLLWGAAYLLLYEKISGL
ncbi:MAG: type V CRISPR-associated protein Cas4 [Lachnospiraceae bacterium]|nr:type V CRISPR-associated protein Cas4 [Lachnospiraceae bacterium]